ncbi:MAG TPA: N-formylglutamate amidohydrolase [Sedimenticola sp.]|nr:N-formylglutamate amidohydrolase [Sedimenticola sp.]
MPDSQDHDHPLWDEHLGGDPVIVTAVHSGHALREELREIIALDEKTRLREEDPFTDAWVCISDNYILPERSRFEVDLNRARDEAVYLSPGDAWGLKLWKTPPTQEMIIRSLEEYDAFYKELRVLFDEMRARHHRFVVLDLHAYNYRRAGPKAPPEDPRLNPDVNIGTGTLDRRYWAPVVDRFIHDLRAFDFLGRHLDVRENVKFIGRQFPRWVHTHYPRTACVLAVEFKKFYMDEWSGLGDPVKIQAVRQALTSTIPGIKAALASMQ